MSEAVEMVKQSSPIIVQRPTLARRVSGMFKDGNYSGPPLLFRHASMQRLRHCCQNLNLLPYLLYSFGNSKSHPAVQKLHRQFSELMKNVLIFAQIILQSMLRMAFVKHSLEFITNLHKILLKNIVLLKSVKSETDKFVSSTKVFEENAKTDLKCEFKISKFKRRERQRISIVLTIAVYLALLVLASQLVGIFSVMIFGKYPPGFIFMISSLFFLGYITMKIMAHDKYAIRTKNDKKKKSD